MFRHWRVGSAVLCAGLVLAGCSTEPTSTGPTAGTVAYELPTHCGIQWLRYNDQWFERAGGHLDGGSGTAPNGWDDPIQKGSLEVSTDRAIFTDHKGHREVFVRGGSGPTQQCA